MNYKNNRELNALLTQSGLHTQKANLVFSFTAGRSESRADLTDVEAEKMIIYLRGQITKKELPGDKMRKSIIAMAHEMHWQQADKKIDLERLNNWCVKFGMFKKRLNDHSESELSQLVTQFTQVYRHFIKHI